MASYLETVKRFSNGSTLYTKVVGACLDLSNDIVEQVGPPAPVEKLAWARLVFEDPDVAANSMFRALLARKKGKTIGELNSMTDNNVKNVVDSLLDFFIENPLP